MSLDTHHFGILSFSESTTLAEESENDGGCSSKFHCYLLISVDCIIYVNFIFMRV
jgi:hypothetical protein